MMLQILVRALGFGVCTFDCIGASLVTSHSFVDQGWRELPLRQAISPSSRGWSLTLYQHEQWGLKTSNRGQLYDNQSLIFSKLAVLGIWRPTSLRRR